MANPLDYPDPVGARPFGLGSDPRDILHRMKTEARAEEAPKMPSLSAGMYEGAGGYGYEVMTDGSIKIVKAPNDRGIGTTLKPNHPMHDAISDELEGLSPTDSLRGEEADILASMVAESERQGLAAAPPSKLPRMAGLSDDAQEAFDRTKAKMADKNEGKMAKK